MFTPKTLSFLRSLKRNNDRAWFHERRDQYDTHVRAPMVAVIERLSVDMTSFAPEFAADLKSSLIRPWRDARFTDDKRPLKTHVAARFPHRVLGRSNGAGLYFEVAPGWVWIGGGMWSPETAHLHAIREHIAAHHDELDSIVRAPAFKKLGGLQGDRLTRVPLAFPKDHPAAHYLQFKQFMGSREESASFACRPDFYKHLLATFKTVVPLCRFINEPLVARQREHRVFVFAPDEREPGVSDYRRNGAAHHVLQFQRRQSA